ncbi:MAG TPA: hypothetical protein VNZ45_14145 [Bacteroidia bacterium]|jgi:hypothetical protein|nr:hypothetical protein [Bacteroidia bacterium]
MNGSVNGYAYITAPATTLLKGNETNRVILNAIQINKTLTGTLTIKSGGGSGTIIGVIASGTIPGTYWITTDGLEIENPAIINGSTEDVTVMYGNI